MNFCTHCGSYYSEPGTCNCYAEVGRWGADRTDPFRPIPQEPPQTTPPFPAGTKITIGPPPVTVTPENTIWTEDTRWITPDEWWQ